MKAERIIPVSLDKEKAKEYAVSAAESALHKKVTCVKYLGGGSFGKAYSVVFEDGKRIVVKFLCAEDMVQKEVFDLKFLGEHCPVKMPKVLFVKNADNTIPLDCYGMEMLPGKPVFYVFRMLFAGKQKRQAFADQVTESLHAVHQCTNRKFGDIANPTFDTWQECYKPFAEQVLICAENLYQKGELSEKIITAMRSAWDKFDIIFSEKVEKACLIHGDLNVGNIMADKKGNLSGFIDPLNSMFADVEYDLFQFYNLTGKRLLLGETYFKKYGASKYWKEKLAFYGLWNEVFCYIKSGVLVPFIMNPLVKNMNRVIEKSFQKSD